MTSPVLGLYRNLARLNGGGFLRMWMFSNSASEMPPAFLPLFEDMVMFCCSLEMYPIDSLVVVVPLRKEIFTDLVDQHL